MFARAEASLASLLDAIHTNTCTDDHVQARYATLVTSISSLQCYTKLRHPLAPAPALVRSFLARFQHLKRAMDDVLRQEAIFQAATLTLCVGLDVSNHAGFNVHHGPSFYAAMRQLRAQLGHQHWHALTCRLQAYAARPAEARLIPDAKDLSEETLRKRVAALFRVHYPVLYELQITLPLYSSPIFHDTCNVSACGGRALLTFNVLALN